MTGCYNLIEGASALSDFRTKNSAEVILDHIETHQHVLISWSVGVGKSHNMDSVIKMALQDYDLIIVLLPTRALIDERALIRQPETGIKVTNIEPRPQKTCGEHNEKWVAFEKNGLSQVAKKQLCGNCPHKQSCDWLKQYSSDALASTQVVFATQAHLKNNPGFIRFLMGKTKAVKPLVIFDEAAVSLTSYTKSLSHHDMQCFINAIDTVPQESESLDLKNWLQTLSRASSSDIQQRSAWSAPQLKQSLLLQILEAGIALYGSGFRNVFPLLKELCLSPIESRQVDHGRNVCFASSPVLQDLPVLLYSGTVALEVLNHRLQVTFVSPYQDYSFLGEATTWLNIASSTGTNTNFGGNKKQILYFFAQLTLKRLNEGKRVMLISKKSRIGQCINEINALLVSLDASHLKVVKGADYEGDSNQIPIIHYGVIGINKFEHFDCAYCLNSFYITPDILSNSLQDNRAEMDHIDLTISVTGQPRRRIASVAKQYRFTDIAMLANPMLQTLEMGTVIQTVGRVRPFTNTREIITYQNDCIEGLPYTAEFDNLTGIREYFGLNTQLKNRIESTTCNVQRLKKQGLKQSDIAAALNISVRTVRRHYK